ncbi:ABC transporter ATP-binding protein [Phytoactinopolyspora mesophila]|uniref:ABC-type quaternary amine transporter n=1 Tax=Phytoactinopolyspora mesophila TaxID=2650750 RepID=A0A7K3MA61_9ACTN|nr:ABC transporter ATP-binding protein [Phytoactinopolyspora mesophila]NDL60173.1 ATP-binding cassette domain-containing protein [Phytoactinopolyspora mesophila]
MAHAHLRLAGLRKTYGDAVAVDDVSLDIERGAFTCLLGPSGCGKTTTLRMIAGFVEPDAGDILIDGVSQRGRSAHRRPTSIVFQDYALFPHMKVFDNVAYGLRAKRFKAGEVTQRVNATLELMGLDELAERFPRQLSGGQQQRVALARSVVTEPEVLLMDEPLSNLDAKLRVRLRTDLRALQQRLGITTVYVTHDQEEALAMSDEVAVMLDGRLEQVGQPYELYDRPRTPFVADFIGLNNFLPATVRKVAEQAVVVELSDGQALEVSREKTVEDVSQGDDVVVVARPEALRVLPMTADTGAASPSEQSVAASLIDSQFLGPLRRHWVHVSGTDVIVDEHDPDPAPIAAPGADVKLRMPRSRLTVMPPR